MADYGSDLRDQAQILALLQEYDLAESEQVKRMFALADRLNSRSWLSTQERNALFMAAARSCARPIATGKQSCSRVSKAFRCRPIIVFSSWMNRNCALA